MKRKTSVLEALTPRYVHHARKLLRNKQVVKVSAFQRVTGLARQPAVARLKVVAEATGGTFKLGRRGHESRVLLPPGGLHAIVWPEN